MFSILNLCCCALLLITYSRKPFSSIQQITVTSLYNFTVVNGNGMYAIINGNFLYVGYYNGVIQQRDLTNNLSLNRIFSDPITSGNSVWNLEIIEDRLISFQNSRKLVSWNLTTGNKIEYTTATFGAVYGGYLKQKNMIITTEYTNRGFQLFQITNLSNKKYLSSLNTTSANHKVFVSPNQQVIFDWDYLNSRNLTVYNLVIDSLIKINEFFLSTFDWLFSSDSQQLIIGLNGALQVRSAVNSYRLSKKIQIFKENETITSIKFLNEQSRIFLFSTNQSKLYIYDQPNNQLTSFLGQPYRIRISEDGMFILQYSIANIIYSKISCSGGYFYDSGFCRPCWVNNCSICDADTGFCLSCNYSNQFVKYGKCMNCSKFCLSCEMQTGNCLTCQYPYQINIDSQCSLQADFMTDLLRAGMSILTKLQVHAAHLLIMSINQFELYNYHNRDYGKRTRFFLKPINIFQFTFIRYQTNNNLYASLRTFSSYENVTTNRKFAFETDLDFNFWNAGFIFFVQIIPQTLMIYLVFNFLFLLLFNYKVSKFIRPYSFYLFILPCIFGNHVQYLVYIAANQLQAMIFITLWDKMCLMFFTLFLFVLVLYIIAFPFLVFIFKKKKLRKYFFNDCVPNLVGAMTMNILVSYQSLITSMIQSFMFQSYVLQMILIIIIQAIVMIGIFVMEKFYSCFERKMTFICFVVNQFLMILVNFLLIQDYYYRSNQDAQTMQVTDQIISIVMWCIIANVGVYTLNSLIPDIKIKQQGIQKNQRRNKIKKSNKTNIVIFQLSKKIEELYKNQEEKSDSDISNKCVVNMAINKNLQLIQSRSIDIVDMNEQPTEEQKIVLDIKKTVYKHKKLKQI